MRKICCLVCIVVPFLFACGSGRSYYTKDEAFAIVNKMNNNKMPKVYVYAKPNIVSSYLKVQGKPFYCSVDENGLGDVTPGEYVIFPVKHGQHTLVCKQDIEENGSLLVSAASLSKGGAVNGTLPLTVDDSDVYVEVNNGLTVFSSLVLKESKTAPDKFETYQLSKTCEVCSK